MVIQEAIELFKNHQKATVKKSTLKSYGKFLDQFRDRYSASEILSVSADQIGRFLEDATEGLSRSTRHLRYAQIKAFLAFHLHVSLFFLDTFLVVIGMFPFRNHPFT